MTGIVLNGEYRGEDAVTWLSICYSGELGRRNRLGRRRGVSLGVLSVYYDGIADMPLNKCEARRQKAAGSILLDNLIRESTEGIGIGIGWDVNGGLLDA